MPDDRLQEFIGLVERHAPSEGLTGTAVPGLCLLRFASPGLRLPAVYRPCLCVIVQGAKDVLLESSRVPYAAGQYLVVSLDMPVIGCITQASPDKPYLCLQVDIDPGELCAVAQDGSVPLPKASAGPGLFVGTVDAPLADCLGRLARLLDAPDDIPALAPLIRRELAYRLIRGDYGPAMAQIAVKDSRMGRIARVIATLQEDLARPVQVEDLARLARMSPSTFHHHFKLATAMSPLRYLKRLRLLEARRLMLARADNVSGAARRVGYASSSQFSREYARLFGAPPSADLSGARAHDDIVYDELIPI